ncbi:MAG: thiamine pyrophosphate-dependent dehydrogenase E1 component subunit alpha [Kovacikia sp.]
MLYEELFYKALRIRLVEERIIELYPSDRIQSPVHLSIGQEAIAVGICQSLRLTDLLFGSYRSHAFYLAKGGDLNLFFAELYGKLTGGCQGKAGSMHLTAPEIGFMGSSAVIASTIPHAIGAALATKQLNKDQVIVVAFGDGATEQGVYHESLNFVALHQLPVIFVCENNRLAVHSCLEARQSYRIVDHVSAYGIPTTQVAAGYDLIKVHDSFAEILQQVRQSKSPHFLEVQTFRYKEHVGPGDDYAAGYRSIQELERWQANDPLIQNRELVEQFTPAIVQEIDAAVEFAESSPAPGREHLLTDVF